ncbi:hypothetical protein CITRIK5_30031 [Citricoccus sp. K5]|nr:hypothetical protein CITRIK5_30031 [Citricoccus sp. K5]
MCGRRGCGVRIHRRVCVPHWQNVRRSEGPIWIAQPKYRTYWPLLNGGGFVMQRRLR